MRWLDRLRTLLGVHVAANPLAPRHERREAARRRRHETGDPLWTSDDRHLGPAAERVLADVAAGTPGHFGSVHTTRDD